MKTRHYILDGNYIVQPCDNVIEWARRFNSQDRVVGKTEVGDMRISTVFLGLDHSFGLSAEPLLFETMIFGGAFAEEEYQKRCSTWAQAEEQHEIAVRLARAQLAFTGTPSDSLSNGQNLHP